MKNQQVIKMSIKTRAILLFLSFLPASSIIANNYLSNTEYIIAKAKTAKPKKHSYKTPKRSYKKKPKKSTPKSPKSSHRKQKAYLSTEQQKAKKSIQNSVYYEKHKKTKSNHVPSDKVDSMRQKAQSAYPNDYVKQKEMYKRELKEYKKQH